MSELAAPRGDVGGGDRPTPLVAGGPNAIAVANGIVGDEWSLWIVQMAMNSGSLSTTSGCGPVRSPRSVLTARLNRLVEHDIMDRVRYNSHPLRHEYRLTARGRQMWPILLTMWAWEREWVNDPDENLPEMDTPSAARCSPRSLVCEACDERVEARDVVGRFGPSGGWERSMPSAATRRRAHSGHRPNELITQTMALIGNRWSAACSAPRSWAPPGSASSSSGSWRRRPSSPTGCGHSPNSAS